MDNNYSNFVNSIKKVNAELGKSMAEMSKMKSTIPRYDTSILNSTQIKDILSKSMGPIENPLVEINNRQVEVLEENNSYLSEILKYNQEISNYNKELVSLNEKILNKINLLDDTLIFLNETFSNKCKSDEEHSQQELSLLVQLMTIIEDKDSSKLQEFMKNIGAPVGVGLLIEALKIKFGLG